MKELNHKADDNAKYRFVIPIIAFSVLTFLVLVHVMFGVTLAPWALYPPFADLITITGSVDCVRAGMDPYITTIFDPWGRTYNYPKIWLHIFDFLNFGRGVTNPLGVALIYLFTLTTSFIFDVRKWKKIIFVLLIFFSPPILLLLERCNCDIMVYVVILCSILYVRKVSVVSEAVKLHLSYLLILFAGMLKIYPFFLLLILFFEKTSRKNILIILTYSVIIIGGYLALTYKDILFVTRNTPKLHSLSYGKNVSLQIFLEGKSLLIVANALVALVLGSAFYVSAKFKERLNKFIPPFSHTENKNVFLFLTGGIIYTGTFFIGNNFDYRLVYLLLTIPFLLDIFNHSQNKKLNGSIGGLMILLFYSFFIGSFVGGYKYMYVLKELSSWSMLFFISLILFHLFKTRNEVKHRHTGI